MHSFVARLRARAISQSTTVSSSTRSDESIPSPPGSPTSLLPSSVAGPSSGDVSPPVVGRRILPHVNELMNSFSTEAERSQGLTPPPSAPRSPLEEHAEALARHAGSSDLDMDSLLPSRLQFSHRSSRKSKSSSSKTSESLAASVPYSTFGRPKPPSSAQVSASSASIRSPIASVDTFAASGMPDRHYIRKGPRASTTSLHRYEHSRLPSARASSRVLPLQRSKSSSNLHSDDERQERPSPTHTTSSRPHSTRQSDFSGSVHSTRSQSVSLGSVHTPVQQVFQLSSSSPHTFGHPSPPDVYYTPGSQTAAMTSPPPLPPLVHPELVASLATRPKVYDISNMATTALRRRSSFNGKTYPPRRRRSKDPSINENAVPFPSGGTFGRSLRNYASMPGVRQIFQTQRPLSRSHSTTRRFSAEWNASQAISGVTQESLGPWPAEVSKEILRISLGVGAFGLSGGNEFPADAEVGQPHEGNVVSLGSDGRPCSPPLTSNAPLTTDEDDTEGGGEHIRRSRNSDNPASIARGGLIGEEGSMSIQDGSSGTLKGNGFDSNQPATLPRASGAKAYRKSILLSPSSKSQGPEAGPSSLYTPSPPTTPSRLRTALRRPSRISSEPTLMQVPETPTKKGKRKAEEIDITPPDQRHAQHATFAIPSSEQRRALTQSEPSRAPSSHAPSAYQRKRVRLSDSSPTSSVKSTSRPGSAINPADVGSVTGRHPSPIPRIRTHSRAASTRSNRQSIINTIASTTDGRERRRTMSQVSIPVSALVAPHPPSIGRSSTYHMRDPRRPVVRRTSWAPHFKSEDEEASPKHAWLFFIGFILFPLWWIASFLPIPQTRHVGGTDTEKAVTLDDPQVEQDARSWRFRCRIMFAVSLVTYVPFIILVAIFAPR